MKKRKFSAVLSIVLTLLMVFNCSMGVSAYNGDVTYTSKSGQYTATKISHPNKPLGTTDGIIDYVGNGVVSALDKGQGDRSQNYAWAAVPYGDCIYLTTNYNSMVATLEFMDTVLGHDYDKKQMESVLDVFYNGSFHTGVEDGANVGGTLVKINVLTNEVTLLMSRSLNGYGCQLRNGCEYKGKIYFCGAVNGLPKIVQVDPETDECKIVHEGISQADYYQAYLKGFSPTIRGICEFDGKLVISTTSLDGTHILISDHPWDGQEAFTEIANDETLFNYPAYRFCDSIYGGAIWEMTEFNGKLYVSICTGTPENQPDYNTMQSFAIVRGEENADGSWSWTPIAGNKKDGARYTFGIDPERTRAGAGVLQVYDGYLYIGEYNDEEIALERIIFESDFDFMNENLKQSVNLYRMDKDENMELVVGDATKMFPKGSLSGLGSGFGRNENQYIWRMTEYQGKLYVGTFDTSSLLEPVGQFSNGNLLKMSVNDWTKLLGYVKTLLDLRLSAGNQDGENTADLKYLFDNYTVAEIAQKLAGNTVAAIEKIAGSGTQLFESLKTIREIAQGFLECSKYLSKATRGFDLYVSDDGINYKAITIDGFGDPYNHGLRVFADMGEGLMVGTANPFYAAQVWMLEENADYEETEDKGILSTLLEKFEEIFKFFENLFDMFLKRFVTK
ncbi:MAG: hypothetical protein NC122_04625 [Faecalibacterium sp.]|nr:hypothetical protein [Ruminococcus sp.]MCM1391823.1 hypothetical protein [Ruminococcus sp.]MCM1485469.1 hypothetical protein [Faecalibacterium sp.]